VKRKGEKRRKKKKKKRKKPELSQGASTPRKKRKGVQRDHGRNEKKEVNVSYLHTSSNTL